MFEGATADEMVMRWRFNLEMSCQPMGAGTHKDGNSCACLLRLTAGQVMNVHAKMEIVQ